MFRNEFRYLAIERVDVMHLVKVRITALFLSCVATTALSGCSKGTTNGAPPTNSKEQSATASPSASTKPPASRAPGGDAIDTSKLDADVAQAETSLKEKPNDGDAKTSLAHAYLARAGALTKARQYRSALGDYRRTLKYDPENKEAVDMSGTIISILKSMGREIPAEGQEPAPLPLDTTTAPEPGKQKSY